MEKFTITPSILNANFLYLDKEINKLKKINLKRIHYDVMDYDFVPNLTFGAKILKDIRKKYSDFYIDIHFMVRIKRMNLLTFLKPFLDLHPNLISMHIESLTPNQIREFLKICREHKIKASLAIKPTTGIEVLIPYLEELDNVLVMTVEPGFGGQRMIGGITTKIEHLNHLRLKRNYLYAIEVDGGITPKNFRKVIEAGADDLVVGSYLFQSKDLEKAYEKFQK